MMFSKMLAKSSTPSLRSFARRHIRVLGFCAVSSFAKPQEHKEKLCRGEFVFDLRANYLSSIGT